MRVGGRRRNDGPQGRRVCIICSELWRRDKRRRDGRGRFGKAPLDIAQNLGRAAGGGFDPRRRRCVIRAGKDGAGLVAIQRNGNSLGTFLRGEDRGRDVEFRLDDHARRDRHRFGSEEQGFFRRAPTHQRVNDNRAAMHLGAAPRVHGGGGAEIVALIDPRQHLAALKGAETDIGGERHQRVELRLSERRIDNLRHGLLNSVEIIAQQRLGVVAADYGIGARGLGVAIADRPAILADPGRAGAKAFKAFDQGQALGRNPPGRRHGCLVSTRTHYCA